jgi:hypothetical protein
LLPVDLSKYPSGSLQDFGGACTASSPSAPPGCTEDCNVYIEEWGVSWLEFAELECQGSYPVANLTSFTQQKPPPGNVSFSYTQQCKKCAPAAA